MTVVLSDSKVAFLGEGEGVVFVQFSTELCLWTALHNQRNMFSCFPNKGISSKPIAFLSLIFFNMASSSSLNCPSLISSWPLIIFWIDFSVVSGGFLSRFLKCSFHFWGFPSWQATFSFALKVLFLSLTLFTACHATCDCLSPSEFLI